MTDTASTPEIINIREIIRKFMEDAGITPGETRDDPPVLRIGTGTEGCAGLVHCYWFARIAGWPSNKYVLGKNHKPNIEAIRSAASKCTGGRVTLAIGYPDGTNMCLQLGDSFVWCTL